MGSTKNLEYLAWEFHVRFPNVGFQGALRVLVRVYLDGDDRYPREFHESLHAGTRKVQWVTEHLDFFDRAGANQSSADLVTTNFLLI